MTEESRSEKPIHFDVTSEPWIGVIAGDGTRKELGLADLLNTAHELRAVTDPMPPVEGGLLRLLVAFALDMFQPNGSEEWEEVWMAGRFDPDRVRDYFRQNAGRFDLFDTDWPFLQDGGAEGTAKPLAGLLPAQPAGTNAVHFHHGPEDDFAVSPPAAARLLAAVAPFMTAGGAGLSPSINGAPPWYVLLQGSNLFQSIWLNCVAHGDLKPNVPDDKPAWRDERPLTKAERVSAGLLEALTWRPRRIRLLPQRAPNGRRCALTGRESHVLVSRMQFSAGWSTRFASPDVWSDPNVAYRAAKEGRTVLRPREGKAVWRDTAPLALLNDPAAAERPRVVTQFDQLIENEYLSKETPLKLVLYGMRTDLKMKVYEWHREELVLPASLLLKRSSHAIAEKAMQLADDAAYALRVSVRHVYPRDGDGNDKAFEALIARSLLNYWNELQPHFVGNSESLLEQLAETDAEDTASVAEVTGRWKKALSAVAWRALDYAIGELDTDGSTINRHVEAQNAFRWRLWALLNPVEAAAAKAKRKKEKVNA